MVMKKMRIKHLLSVLLYIVFIDAMWIVSVAMPLYQSQLGAIVNQKEYFIHAAVLIYALLFGGFYVLILRWMAQHPPRVMVTHAVIYGVTIYGVYSLTNYTIFPSWSLLLVVTDICWGSVLFGSSALLMIWLKKYDR
jgi:uncharacterized membrane protein